MIWDNFEICLLYFHIQKKITTCCWQYDICNQRTRLTNNNRWNHDLGQF